MPALWERINALATRQNAAPAPSRKAPRPEPEGPWEMSGPEEDDSDETVLVCNCDADSYEVIEITAGTLAKRKSIARRIARLLNEGKGELK